MSHLNNKETFYIISVNLKETSDICQSISHTNLTEVDRLLLFTNLHLKGWYICLNQ